MYPAINMEPDQYEFILDHYKNPRNYGTIEGADVSHEEGIPSCGDVVRLDLKLDDGRVEDIEIYRKGMRHKSGIGIDTDREGDRQNRK